MKGKVKNMGNLGIIGGLDPMATAYFMQLLTQMSDARLDQEHMEIYMISKPSIPDRTSYILGKSRQSPLPEMVEVGKQLKQMGADILAIPCVTAHFFHDELQDEVGLPVINAIEETAFGLWNRGIKNVGILATEGTIKSQIFQRVLENYKVNSVIPDRGMQEIITDIIYHKIKAGNTVDIEEFEYVSTELNKKGAQVIILACTELSLIKKDLPIGIDYLDVMEVLAAKAVQQCGRLKTEYKKWITL